MSSFAPVQQSPFGEFSPFSNVFAQSMAQPPLATGYPLGQGTTGPADLSGLLGISDPGMKFVLNGILSSILTGSMGKDFVPANFSPGTNMYSQMKARNLAGDFRSSVGQAAQSDQRAVFEMLRGVARITGAEFGPREQEAARSFASSASGFLPYIASVAPDMLDRMAGSTGSATVMAQNMFMGGRYATDPVTGRRGISAESSAAMTSRVFENLYGPGKNIAEMGGIRAGQAGALYDEMQRRGLMGGAPARSEALQKIAKDMNMTVAEATALPDVDAKIREVDADRVSEKLKDMSKAVSAMREIFGEMGQPDAPMQQLVGAIESLTQANIPSMEPAKLERMIRDTSNTARAAGIDMPTTFRLMGSTAAMADRAGIDRIFAPEITMQAMRENDATKRIFGGARAFGLASSDKLMNMQQQLGVEATKDFRTQQLASVARLVDQYKFKPKEGSDLAKVYDVITGKRPMTEEDKRLLVSVNQRPGGMAAFLKEQGVAGAVIQDLAANQAANAEYMHKYNMGTRVGKTLQGERAVQEITNFGRFVIDRYAKDDSGLQGTSANLKESLLKNSGELSQVAARALMNASKEELDKPEEVVRKALEAQLKSKGITNLNDKDKQLISSMSAGLADNAKSYAQRAGFQYLSNMQATLSPKILREAAITGEQVSQESRFQETLRGVGKTDVTQRLADLIRNAGPNTQFKEGAAAILGFQNKEELMGVLGPEIEAMDKASKQFATFDAKKVEDAYLRDSSIKNRLSLEDNTISKEKRDELSLEQTRIKDRLISAGYATKENVDQKFQEFSNFSSFEEYKNMDKKAALDKSADNLKNFEKIHGVAVRDVQNFSGAALANIGTGNALNTLEKIFKSSGMQLLDKFGATSPGDTRFRELNEAYNQLTSTKKEDLKYGVEALNKFTAIYGSNAGMLSAGGVKGDEAVKNAKSITNFLNNISGATGTNMDDLLTGQVREGEYDLQYLKDVRQQDLNAITDLLDTNEARRNTAKSNLDTNIKNLQNEAENTKDPKVKSRNEQRIKEIKALQTADVEQLTATRDASQKTVDNLKDDSVKAIKEEFNKFSAAQDDQKKQNNALDSLIANLNKTHKIEITRDNVGKYLTKHALTKEDRDLLDAKDADGKSLIEKENVLTEGDRETLKKYRNNYLNEEMTNKLLGYKGKDDKSLTKEQVDERESLLKAANVKDIAEFEKVKGEREKAVKEISDRTKVGEKDINKIDELNRKANSSNLREAKANEVLVDNNRGKLTDKDAANLDAQVAAKEKADNNISSIIEKFGKFDPESLRAVVGSQGVGKLAVSAMGSLLETTKMLGKQLVSPEGPKLSEENVRNRQMASRLVNNKAEASRYLKDIGIDESKTKGLKEGVASRVAGDLNYAANEAARVFKLKEGSTDSDKLKKVRELLSSDPSKMSQEQLALRNQLVDGGITKDLFGGKGNDAVTFNEAALKDKFRQTEKKMADGALRGKPGDPGYQKNEVVAIIPKGTTLNLAGTLKSEGKVVASGTFGNTAAV